MKTFSKKLPVVFNLPIEWTDEDWAKPLVQRTEENECASLRSPFRNGLTHHCTVGRRTRRGFTLIELLVVIGIIALLAGLLFPVLGRVQRQGKIKMARVNMSNIAAAVSAYQAAYTLAPLPKPNPYNPPAGKDFSFSETNSDIVAILMGQAKLANAGHQRNPQKLNLLTVKLGTGKAAGSVSSDDLNFRDPWGNEYVIAFDLDYDNKVDITGDPVYSNYPYPNIPGAVIVWSKGPDGKAGNLGDPSNKDNLTSWE